MSSAVMGTSQSDLCALGRDHLYPNYRQAPIVIRQLELIAGERGFRDAMREYLKRHAFANATWLDLVRILEVRNPEVAKWSRVWVESRGRPEITGGTG